MENLYLIVGLGNPGRRYAATRHNAGFMLAEELAKRWRVDWTEEKKFKSRVAWAGSGEQKVLLAQPLTFMNVSGAAVGGLSSFYHAQPDRLLIAVDDADLPLGQIRLRPGGSSGGHHGLESIEQHLGTREFARLRMGIGREVDGPREITDYVLAEFSPDEQVLLRQVLDRAASQVECWLAEGIAKAMSRYNGPVAAEDI